MNTESHTQHEIQNTDIISEEEVIACPNCKREGPRSFYCNFCGYPLYMGEVDETEGTEEDEIISESESGEGEPLIEAGMENPTPALESLEEAEQEDLYEESVDFDVRARTKETLYRILAILKGSDMRNDNEKS